MGGGGKGVAQNTTIVLIKYVNGTVTRGRGQKIPKFLRIWTLYVKGPKVDRHKSAGGGGEQNRFGKINGISNVGRRE